MLIIAGFSMVWPMAVPPSFHIPISRIGWDMWNISHSNFPDWMGYVEYGLALIFILTYLRENVNITALVCSNTYLASAYIGETSRIELVLAGNAEGRPRLCLVEILILGSISTR